MLNTPQPTRAQQLVLDFIEKHVQEQDQPPTYQEIADYFGWKSVTAAMNHVQLLAKKGLVEIRRGSARGLRLINKKAQSTELREVPLLGAIPAGRPLEAIVGFVETIGIDPRMFPDAEVFALRVNGESMTGAGIRDGDIALVRQTPEASDGDIVVALIDGEATLKRLFHRDGKIVLHAENPEFSDIVIAEDVDFSLTGVAIGIVRKLSH